MCKGFEEGGLLVGMIVNLSLLKRLHAVFRLVFTRNVPPNGVVPCERAATERAVDADSLMPLADVGAKVSFVPIQPFAERAFQFLAWNNANTT